MCCPHGGARMFRNKGALYVKCNLMHEWLKKANKIFKAKYIRNSSECWKYLCVDSVSLLHAS